MIRVKTISEFHRMVNVPPPQHPLFSVIDVGSVPPPETREPVSLVMDFYSIGIKRMHNVSMQYGQRSYDFNEGIMSFISPGPVFRVEVSDKAEEMKRSGWAIYIHPDFIWNTSLAKNIRGYEFWDYSLNEALFLSEKEESVINRIIENILVEYNSSIDRFSRQIIISQLEGLLTYADRFYNRQFITREKSAHQVLERLESLLDDYFNSNDLATRGLPTVQYVAEQLFLSPKYLSSLLRTITGQNTQQHIHDKLIEKAKEKLSGTSLSVSEIAYQLGFEHLQSFSKLFKAKTTLSPLDFRASFN